MKNIGRITRDYDSHLSEDQWRDDLQNCLQELDVNVWTKYKQWFWMEELLKNQKTLPDQFSKNVTVRSLGYCQGEYTLFQIYYNGDDKKLKYLKILLERLYTHKNDYLVENVEELITGHTKVVDRCVVNVSDVEFPELQDIVKVIEEMQGGVKVFDEYKLINK